MILRGLHRDLKTLVLDELDNLDLAVVKCAYLIDSPPSLQYQHVYHCISSNYIHLWVWILCNCRAMIPSDWTDKNISRVIVEFGSMELIEATHTNTKLDMEEVAISSIECFRQEVFMWVYKKRHMNHISDSIIESARNLMFITKAP